jgi:anaphase-promoting complex subunit 4
MEAKANDISIPLPVYNPIDPTKHTLPQASDESTTLDLHSEHADLIIHTFPSSGPKSRPMRIEVNGRQGRRVACVLYSDQQHYDILDIDSHSRRDNDINEEEEEDDDYEDGDENVMAEDEEMVE